MRRTALLTLALTLVVVASVAVATSQMQQNSTAATMNETIQGCLSQSGSDYFLTTIGADQRQYRITGDTSPLAKHVGHTVSVTGNVSKQQASSPSSGTAETGTIEMQDFHHVSASCSTNQAPAKQTY